MAKAKLKLTKLPKGPFKIRANGTKMSKKIKLKFPKAFRNKLGDGKLIINGLKRKKIRRSGQLLTNGKKKKSKKRTT